MPQSAPQPDSCEKTANEKQASIVITGASGFVGRQLIPRLEKMGWTLLLVGRDTKLLRRLYPSHNVRAYDDWERYATNYDALINLAVLNNNTDASWNDFLKINVQLPCDIAQKMMSAGISQMIHISSTHALTTTNTFYARSKTIANETLQNIEGLSLTILYLPLVWGDQWPSSLQFLNILPRTFANFIFTILGALKPSLHINTLVNDIASSISQPSASRIVSDNISENIFYRSLKSITDYGFALSVMGFFWWTLLLITFIIRATSPGPAIFRQERVGLNGKRFICYKFRTMYTGTKQAGTHNISPTSITPFGAFLRRSKLDELPQIFNILKGDLSLVGPRPGLPIQTELFEARHSANVFSVLPGITGWAQIHKIDMSDPYLLTQWDAQYIAMRGFSLDLKIILATFVGRGGGDRVINHASSE